MRRDSKERTHSPDCSRHRAARGASTGVTAGRWEDVEPLLASGADVIATIRISQIESLGDVVARITGEVETARGKKA